MKGLDIQFWRQVRKKDTMDGRTDGGMDGWKEGRRLRTMTWMEGWMERRKEGRRLRTMTPLSRVRNS